MYKFAPKNRLNKIAHKKEMNLNKPLDLLRGKSAASFMEGTENELFLLSQWLTF